MRWEPWVAWACLAGMLAAGGVSDAWGRMHAPYRGHRIVPVASAPLDGFTQPAGAYSFRKLRTAYAGPAVQLRRVDTTTQNIGFTPGGDFDSAAAAAFCTTACTVQTWYDQSGNSRNMTQATAANQPAYVAACNGSLPCLRSSAAAQSLAGSSVTPATGVMTLSIVARADTVAATCNGMQVDGASWGPWSGGPNWLAFYGSSAFPAASVGAWHAGMVVFNGASSTTRIDSAEAAASLGVPASTTGALIAAGGAANPCSQTEAIWWDNYQLTAGERTALANNQRDYWTPAPLDTFATPAGAYSMRRLKSSYAGPAIRIRRASDNAELDINFLGCTGFTGCPIDTAAANAHCAATTCSAAKWYDQSGNARDVLQASAPDQPLFIFNCIGALPCLRTPTAGTTRFLSAGSFTPATGMGTMAAVANRPVGTGLCFMIGENGATPNYFIMRTATTWSLGPNASNINATVTNGAWHAGVGVLNGASSVINMDGTETTGTAVGNVNAGQIAIGGGSAATTCDQTEAVIWDNYALTPSERSALIVNQRSFWGF